MFTQASSGQSSKTDTKTTLETIQKRLIKGSKTLIKKERHDPCHVYTRNETAEVFVTTVFINLNVTFCMH